MSTSDTYERHHLFGAAAIFAVAAVVLAAMGQVWWCKCGSPVPWSWDTWSMHNSQHILDAYSFSHMQHGLVFFAALYLLGDRVVMGTRLLLALAFEAAWEVLENTPMVIERYREATISLDYFGDSVANSMSDLAACWLGFEIARRLPWWGTLALFVVVEALMVLTIKDSLILNVIMLLYPLDAIRQWQAA